MFLIFLFLFAFAEETGKGQDTCSDYQVTSELHSDAAVVVEAQQIDFLNSQLPSVENFRFKMVNDVHGLIFINNAIRSKIIFLERISLLVKPAKLLWFYNQYHSSDTEDPPHLS
ncbi:MAG: hypothetical protein IPH20_00855 [Bacteroidales bacterium]|nr:hypothetical protein [Bacteroidales bacterium]